MVGLREAGFAVRMARRFGLLSAALPAEAFWPTSLPAHWCMRPHAVDFAHCTVILPFIVG